MGLRIYINGICQPYSADGDNTYETMKTFSLGVNEKKNIQISFVPVTGKKGDKLNVNFIAMLNPEIKKYDKNFKTFGNDHKINQLLPWKININKDTDSKNINVSDNYKISPISQKELKKYITKNSDGTQRNKLDDKMYIDILKNNSPAEYAVIDMNSNDSLKVRLYGGSGGKYRVSFYSDHKEIDLGSNTFYTDVIIQKNKYSDIEIPVDKSVLNDKNIYAVAVPLSDNSSYADIEKSSSHIIHFE